MTATQGKFLSLLCRIAGARTVLEIGTLGGFSTIWLARGLPDDGTVVTLEVDPKHAAVARANIDRAAPAATVEIVVGPALDSLPGLTTYPAAPFDLVFIDADKPNNPGYLEGALRLSHPGTVIVCDNVVRDGKIVDASSTEPAITGTRRFFEMLRDDPRVERDGGPDRRQKGWDGFALALVR